MVTMTQLAIEVQNLCKNYGAIAAVDSVNFTVQPGELVGFLGLNGAGKSTTIKILTTYLPASRGVAKVAGYDVMYESLQVRRVLGYLPESVPLYPEMRVNEYLMMRAQLKQVPREERTKRIDYCLQRCRIREVRQRLIGTLSKGYRQRVGLADALLANPPVLILDEPLSGLDPVQQEETLDTIRELNSTSTVLFSSHQLADVEKICNRVIIIHSGQIQFDATLDEVAKRSPTLIFEVQAAAPEVKSLALEHTGVSRATTEVLPDHWCRLVIECDAENDLREAIVRKTQSKGWGLRRVELKREKLADTFMKVAYQRGQSELTAG
jgi:ABC-2 type transport system ATP-binding protein